MTSDFSHSSGLASPSSKESRESTDPSARTQLHDLKKSIADDVTAARDAVTGGGEAAGEKIKDMVTEQTGFAARQVGGLAVALEKVGAELENSDQPHVGRYAKQIGGGLENFARQMEGKDAGDLARMAEEFGRKQPLAFLGAAALAGLMASRFLTASAKHKAESPVGNPDPSAGTGSAFDRGGVTNG